MCAPQRIWESQPAPPTPLPTNHTLIAVTCSLQSFSDVNTSTEQRQGLGKTKPQNKHTTDIICIKLRVKVEEIWEQCLFVTVNSLFITCSRPQRVTITRYLASCCANLDLTHAFSPLPLPEYDNRKHSLVSVVTASRGTHVFQEALKWHGNLCVMPQQEASAEQHVHAPGCSSQQKEPLSPGGFRTTVPESTGIDSSSARKQDGAGKNRLGCSYLLHL